MAVITLPRYSRDVWWLRELAVAAALFGPFFALMLGVPHAQPGGFDRHWGGEIQSIPWGSLRFIPEAGSEIGGGLFAVYVAPAALGAWLAWKRQWRLLSLVAAVFVLHYVMISPKQFMTAARPSPAFGMEGSGGLESFPSGHVQWAVSFWGLTAVLGWRALGDSRLRWVVLAAYVLVVAGTMLGRIELGRHWPLDTVAGVLAGLVALRVLVLLMPTMHARAPQTGFAGTITREASDG